MWVPTLARLQSSSRTIWSPCVGNMGPFHWPKYLISWRLLVHFFFFNNWLIIIIGVRWSLEFDWVTQTTGKARTGFLSPAFFDLWGWIILCCGTASVYCRLFSSTSGLCPLNTSRSLPRVDQPEMSPDVARCPPWGKILSAENHCDKQWVTGNWNRSSFIPMFSALVKMPGIELALNQCLYKFFKRWFREERWFILLSPFLPLISHIISSNRIESLKAALFIKSKNKNQKNTWMSPNAENGQVNVRHCFCGILPIYKNRSSTKSFKWFCVFFWSRL